MGKQFWQHDYGERWDGSDIKTLLRLYYRANRPVRGIANHMGRSEPAVRSKIYRLKKQGVTG